ncbi:MAG: hypothetical protein JHC73_15600 [Dolichospermum sp.]|jgi:virulence-associated protein VagC|nr:hypothetical protein [Dolichospermum sp.]
MRLKATDQGLFIPKELLGEAQEFEIITDHEKLIITRIKKSSSIWNLGKNPVECDVQDGAVNHDHYLYNK